MRDETYAKKFYVVACHVLWRELCHFAAVSPNVFDFHFLKQGLHDDPDDLRKRLQEAIDAVPDEYSAILVGYGLCSNGLEGIASRTTRLVVMRGHDCITFLLGSKERYRAYFDQHPGTYWYSPGWIDTTDMPSKERYETALRVYTEKYGEDNAKHLMEMEQDWIGKYSTAAYVDLGFYDTQRHKNYTMRCAESLGWDCDILSGSSDLIMNFLEGRWDSDDFLVVEPGQTIIASHDDSIVDVKAS